MFKTVVSAGLVFIAFTAHGEPPSWFRADASLSEIQATEAGVSAKLKDPESAKFRGIYRLTSTTGKNAFCGEVNARNSYGGYTGFIAFYYSPDIDSKMVLIADHEGGRILVRAACDKPPLPSVAASQVGG